MNTTTKTDNAQTIAEIEQAISLADAAIAAAEERVASGDTAAATAMQTAMRERSRLDAQLHEARDDAKTLEAMHTRVRAAQERSAAATEHRALQEQIKARETLEAKSAERLVLAKLEHDKAEAELETLIQETVRMLHQAHALNVKATGLRGSLPHSLGNVNWRKLITVEREYRRITGRPSVRSAIGREMHPSYGRSPLPPLPAPESKGGVQ